MRKWMGMARHAPTMPIRNVVAWRAMPIQLRLIMFKNKTFLITGASSGLGRSLAIQLTQQNANVALMSRHAINLAETKSLCNGDPLIIIGDICHELTCKSAI